MTDTGCEVGGLNAFRELPSMGTGLTRVGVDLGGGEAELVNFLSYPDGKVVTCE